MLSPTPSAWGKTTPSFVEVRHKALDGHSPKSGKGTSPPVSFRDGTFSSPSPSMGRGPGGEVSLLSRLDTRPDVPIRHPNPLANTISGSWNSGTKGMWERSKFFRKSFDAHPAKERSRLILGGPTPFLNPGRVPSVRVRGNRALLGLGRICRLPLVDEIQRAPGTIREQPPVPPPGNCSRSGQQLHAPTTRPPGPEGVREWGHPPRLSDRQPDVWRTGGEHRKPREKPRDFRARVSRSFAWAQSLHSLDGQRICVRGLSAMREAGERLTPCPPLRLPRRRGDSRQIEMWKQGKEGATRPRKERTPQRAEENPYLPAPLSSLCGGSPLSAGDGEGDRG
jgi:hypothetical protein